MKCIALQHVAFENLGVFEAVFKRHAIDIEYRQAGVNGLSDAEWLDTGLIVILGGPIGVYEQQNYPWLTHEINGIAQRLAIDRPTLGICLGAQIMAAALGARVYPGEEKELCWKPVSLTAAGATSCLSALCNVPMLHWHGDTFDLPAGAQSLARTDVTPNQAFSIGRNALALQFHPEADGNLIEPWLIGHTCELNHAHVSVPDMRTDSMKHAGESIKAGTQMIESWLRNCDLH